MLERDQAAMYVLSQMRRELSICIYTSHPSRADNCFLRDSKPCMLMCAQMHANPVLGSTAECTAMAFGLCLERELLPDTAHLFPSQKKQVRSRDKLPLVGDKGCLPSSFFVREEF